MANPIQHIIPMVVAEDLPAVRRFYGGLPGCEIDIDMPEYVQVAFDVAGLAPQARPALAFMSPKSVGAKGPFGHDLGDFGRRGLLVSVPVADADAHHRALSEADRAPTTAPADRPWGWRSFLVEDPTGVALDFFHVKEESAAADAAS